SASPSHVPPSSRCVHRTSGRADVLAGQLGESGTSYTVTRLRSPHVQPWARCSSQFRRPYLTSHSAANGSAGHTERGASSSIITSSAQAQVLGRASRTMHRKERGRIWFHRH